MTDRICLDDLTSDALDQLHDERDKLARALGQAEEACRRVLAQRQEMAEERFAWQERGDRAEAAIERVRHLRRPVGVVAAAEFGEPPECAACRRAWPCPTSDALDQTKEH